VLNQAQVEDFGVRPVQFSRSRRWLYEAFLPREGCFSGMLKTYEKEPILYSDRGVFWFFERLLLFIELFGYKYPPPSK